jgi:hypothetical protein
LSEWAHANELYTSHSFSHLIFVHILSLDTQLGTSGCVYGWRRRYIWHDQVVKCVLVGFYTHWTYMLIFRRIFLSNYLWQKSDIWSHASYRYSISWEAFLDPSDSYFLFADFVDFLYTLNIYAHFSSHFSQQLFMAEINVYRNQLSWQTGSRNLNGPKTLPTIWYTYRMLVTKYQISAINNCWEKCDEKWAYMFNVYKKSVPHIVGSVFWPVRFLLPVCRRAGVS